MRVSFEIRNEDELQNQIKELIRGELRNMTRAEIQDAVREEVNKKCNLISRETILDVIKSRADYWLVEIFKRVFARSKTDQDSRITISGHDFGTWNIYRILQDSCTQVFEKYSQEICNQSFHDNVRSIIRKTLGGIA